jgi:hypothetical protein
VKQWHREHPGQPIADQAGVHPATVMGPKTDQRNGRSSTSTALTGPADLEGHRHPDRQGGEGCRREDRDEAEPVLSSSPGATKTINRELEAKARAWPG